MSTLTTGDRATHTNGYGGHGNGTNGTNGAPKRKKKRSLLPLMVAVAVVALGGTATAFYYLGDRTQIIDPNLLTYEVQHGPLVVSVTESGTIKAAEQAIIKSEVEGRVSILYIVPEGQQVEKGELLVELDTTEMVEEKLEREIEVQNAEAAYVQAQENLAVVKNQAEADVAAAELAHRFAVEDLKKYQQGDYQQALMEAEAKIAIAKEELERAQQKEAGSEKLWEAKFISDTELQADRLAMQKAELDLQLAEGALRLLQEWEKVRMIDEFESAINQTKMALERAERKARADVVQAEAELRANKAEFDQETDRLARDIAQIAKGKVYAPTDGMVVYATSAEGGWRGNEEPLEAGQEVRERQDLIYLPTPNDRIAEVKVHESALDKIRKGLPARVTVDALPGQEYWGTVRKVSPLPDATTAWLNPDLKVYSTEIFIPGMNEELRTGMSCRAEIIIETFDEATYVPVQSVVRVGGVPTVFVARPGQPPEQREVEIGLDNNSMVVIESGLEPGEQVLLAPPLGDTGTNSTLRSEDVPEDKRQQAEDAKVNPTIAPSTEEGAVSGPEGMNGPGSGPGMGGPGGGPGGNADEAPRQRGGGNSAMMRAFQQLQAKATEEEKQTLQGYMQDQDWQGLQTYSQELAAKYGITLPSRGGPRGGQQPDGERDGPESGQSGDEQSGSAQVEVVPAEPEDASATADATMERDADAMQEGASK